VPIAITSRSGGSSPENRRAGKLITHLRGQGTS